MEYLHARSMILRRLSYRFVGIRNSQVRSRNSRKYLTLDILCTIKEIQSPDKVY